MEEIIKALFDVLVAAGYEPKGVKSSERAFTAMCKCQAGEVTFTVRAAQIVQDPLKLVADVRPALAEVPAEPE